MQLDSTYVAARILGPTFIVGGMALILHNEIMSAAIGDFVDSRGLLATGAFISLLFGLALVTLHRRWDSFTAILVSLIGWAAIVRGAVALLAPELAHTAVLFIVANENIVPIAGCVLALLGLWLSYSGYIAGIFRVDARER